METTYQVEHATSDYIEAIAKYNSEMAMETEKRFLKSETVLEATKKVVEDPQFGFSIVALQKQSLASFLNGCFFFDHTSNCLVSFINSVYVTKEHRRKGLFNLMLDGLISKSLLEDARVIRLYVDADNGSARKVYEAVGMKKVEVELFNIDLLSNSVEDIEFRSVYYEFYDECEFSFERATKLEIDHLHLESMSSILSSDKTASMVKMGASNSFSSKYPSEIYLLKENGVTVGMLGGYFFNCDWTDCTMWCINDIRIESSSLENAQELTAMMLQLLIDQVDSPNRYFTIMMKDGKEWLKSLLKTCGAVQSNYNIYEKVLY